MVKITNIDILLNILNNLGNNDKHFQLYGNSKEYGSSVSVLGTANPATRLTARIIALTPLGEIFFEQSVKLSDESELVEFRRKLSTLQVFDADVHCSSNIITIR